MNNPTFYVQLTNPDGSLSYVAAKFLLDQNGNGVPDPGWGKTYYGDNNIQSTVNSTNPIYMLNEGVKPCSTHSLHRLSSQERDEKKWNASRVFRRNQVDADCGNLSAYPACLMKSITFTETSDISDVSIMILDVSIQNHRDLVKD